MASVKTIRIVTLSTSTAYNCATGTTATSTASGSQLADFKGAEILIQNQSTGTPDIWVGGSDLNIVVGATSTLTGAGIKVTAGSYYSWGQRGFQSASAVQLTDFYIMSTSSNAVATVQLFKAV